MLFPLVTQLDVGIRILQGVDKGTNIGHNNRTKIQKSTSKPEKSLRIASSLEPNRDFKLL